MFFVVRLDREFGWRFLLYRLDSRVFEDFCEDVWWGELGIKIDVLRFLVMDK